MTPRLLLLVGPESAQHRRYWHVAHEAGYQPLMAPTVGAALRFMQRLRPSVVLAVNLPEGCPLVLLQALRSQPWLAQVPLLVVGAPDPLASRQLSGDPHTLLLAEGPVSDLLSLLVRDQIGAA